MNELIHFLVLGKAFGKHIEYVVADMLRPAELLEIQWIHIQLGQYPTGTERISSSSTPSSEPESA